MAAAPRSRRPEGITLRHASLPKPGQRGLRLPPDLPGPGLLCARPKDDPQDLPLALRRPRLAVGGPDRPPPWHAQSPQPNHPCRGVGARHIVTPPYTPRWNGKVERFIQTLQTEWAYAHRYPSSTARAKSLRSFLRYYNRQRPHSSLGDRPPISRVPNVCGQDS